MNHHQPPNPEQHPPPNQHQSFETVQVQGNDNIFNALQAHIINLTQTKIIQISVDEIKTRQLNTTSPYKGLKKFESTDKDYFFGRDQFLAELVNELEQTNLTLLLGASGSGKSSVVRAGLVPLLSEKLGKSFLSLIFTPDQDPFESFYGSLLSRGFSQSQAQLARVDNVDTLSQVVKTLKQPEEFWLIVIDQFEELFTVSASEKRDRFLEGLAKLSTGRATDPQLKIVATMRADFLDRLDPAPANLVAKATQGHRPLITQMQPDELRSAIEQPAAHHGVVFETGLVEDIIKDVQGQAGYLPLLQYTLDLLWETEVQDGGIRDRTLNITSYRQLGGVRGALQQRVDEIYQGLSQPEQLATQRIFLKLVEIGGDVESGTEWRPVRRRAHRAEFADAQEQAVLTQLINQNLLVSDVVAAAASASPESTVEIAHEILLTSWPTLNEWIKDNRQAIALRNRLNDDVRQWQTAKPDDELWSGLKLARVVDLKNDLAFNQILGGFSPEATAFIEASVGLRDRREREKEAQRRRVVLGLSGFSMAALALSGFALYQWQQAQRQATVAQLREQAATVLNWLPTTKSAEALVLAIDTVARSAQHAPVVQSVAQANLLRAVQGAPEINRLQVHELGAFSVAFSPDGKRIVSGGNGLWLWDAQGGQPINLPFQGHKDYVWSVAFSPDGTRIVSGSSDETVRLWDARTGAAIGQPLTGHQSSVDAVAFSPDGNRIVSGSSDQTVRLWNAQSGQPIGRPILGHRDGVISVAFSPDGTRIVSGSDTTIRLWDAMTGIAIGQPLTGHQSSINAVAFSPDGTRIVSGSSDQTVRLWNAQSGQPIGLPLQGHKDGVLSIAFSPDGTRIVSGSFDLTVRLWDAQSGQPIGLPFQGHQTRIYAVAFSPDGTRIVSSDEQTVRLWDVATGSAIGQPLIGHQSPVNTVAFSSNGHHIVSGSADNTLRLWDVATGAVIGSPFTGHQGPVNEVAFSPDSRRIVSGSADTTVRLWDMVTGAVIGRPFIGHESWVNAVAFSPDGTRIVSGSDTTIRLWNATTGAAIGQPFTGHKSWVNAVAFSPDGTQIVSGGEAPLQLWDVTTKVAIGQPFTGHQDWVNAVAFSPDGTRIASGSTDSTVRLWDATTGAAIGHPFIGHQDGVASLAFSPDGTRVVSVGDDSTVRLWNATTGAAIGQPFTGHQSTVNSVAFSPDGKLIVSGGSDGTVRMWDANADWLTIACKRLQYHPLLNQPETVITNDPDFLQVAQRAKATCEQKVWNQAAPPTNQSAITDRPMAVGLHQVWANLTNLLSQASR
ncbi:WD40 repeat domain-containing protein [Leptolyngbya sp. CCNP1308]|uniref:WD40 repeat domain-containing protein n=1 Tax=Leptolyngbya sp. CCNP1308 TaxID=3110255 RepID=UPI002B2139AF|nr:WD40 repeat domain-containing protein [Leptolyngbya sp. CCNP1308]MEA5449635.1 WD40 repeat domain-containing protein [Leptolyngbya sp. CCNP1308]